eukprot:symbB.v1.2.033416.t1/scaffold4149.1/size43842/1
MSEPSPTNENQMANAPQHPVLTASFASFDSGCNFRPMQYPQPQASTYVQPNAWFLPNQDLQLMQQPQATQPAVQLQPQAMQAMQPQVQPAMQQGMLQAPMMLIQQPQMQMAPDGIHAGSLNFGIIIYDLETIHDSERGNYAEKGLHECSQEEQIEWKSRSQIIEFAAVDVLTGNSICVRSRPEFGWEDVKSAAARLFAEDHGHAEIIRDQSLPFFAEVWAQEVLPFLWRASGGSRNLAMLAHNGDHFDHYVLTKEIKRLNLSMEGGPSLVGFDPVTVLKNYYGPQYGTGGLLQLKTLYQQHAMDDCVMLMEVIQHWQDLNMLLAQAIAAQMGHQFCPGLTQDQLIQNIHVLRFRLTQPLPVQPSPPQAQIQMVNGQRMLCPVQIPQERDMRMEMPGVMMWQPEEMVNYAPRQNPNGQAVLLSTTAFGQAPQAPPPMPQQMPDDGSNYVTGSPRMEEFMTSSSSDSERIVGPPPPPPPEENWHQGPSYSGESFGRSVADLEAELLAQTETPPMEEKPKNRRGFPIGKDGTKRDIHEDDRGQHGRVEWKHKEKSSDWKEREDKNHNGWGKKDEWTRRRSWDGDRKSDWWSWKDWEDWEQTERESKNKKKKKRNKRKEWQSKEKDDASGSAGSGSEGGIV